MERSGFKGIGADGPYWEALGVGELALPRCSTCGRWHWPAPFRCPDCGCQSLEWVPQEADGLIYSWTRTWHGFEGLEQFPIPFVSVLVELPNAGGIRLLGRFDQSMGDPAIGRRVRGTPIVSEVFGRSIPAWCWKAHS